MGTFHHFGELHLQRYVNEFDFRYNHRIKLGLDNIRRTEEALMDISGKRLTYRRIDAQTLQDVVRIRGALVAYS